MNGKGVLGAIVAALVVGFTLGDPHVPEEINSAKPAVVSKSPTSSHPDDRHEEVPGDSWPLDRQKVNVASASVAVPHQYTSLERYVRKGPGIVPEIKPLSGELPTLASKPVATRLLILGFVAVAVIAGLFFSRHHASSQRIAMIQNELESQCQVVFFEAAVKICETSYADKNDLLRGIPSTAMAPLVGDE